MARSSSRVRKRRFIFMVLVCFILASASSPTLPAVFVDSFKLAAAMSHRFALNMKLVKDSLRAENFLVERCGVHGGLAPNHFNAQVIGNLNQAMKKSRAHAATLAVNGLAVWDDGEAFVWPQADVDKLTKVPSGQSLS